MRYFNDCGMPYSDELYHYGILGQKWGVRRFQNLDRTWTAEGKIRYGGENHRVSEAIKKVARSSGRAVSSAAKAAGRGAKGAGKFAVKRFKMRHPWAMTDAEVKTFTERYANEKKMKDAMRELRQSSLAGRARKLISDSLLNNVVNPLMKGATERFISEYIKKTPQEREYDRLKTANDIKEIGEKLKKDSTDVRIETLEKHNKLLKAEKDKLELLKYFNKDNDRSTFAKSVEILRNPNKYSSKEFDEALKEVQNVNKGAVAVSQLIDRDGDKGFNFGIKSRSNVESTVQFPGTVGSGVTLDLRNTNVKSKDIDNYYTSWGSIASEAFVDDTPMSVIESAIDFSQMYIDA